MDPREDAENTLYYFPHRPDPHAAGDDRHRRPDRLAGDVQGMGKPRSADHDRERGRAEPAVSGAVLRSVGGAVYYTGPSLCYLNWRFINGHLRY